METGNTGQLTLPGRRGLRRWTKAAAWFLLGRAVIAVLWVLLHIISRGRPVRIGSLNGKGRISIMIGYIEPFLRQLKIDGVSNPLVIIINPGLSPNEQMTLMYGRKTWLLDDQRPIMRKIFQVIRSLLLIGHSPMAVTLRLAVENTYPSYIGGQPSVYFLPDEMKKGREILAEMGVSEGAEFICFSVRDTAYYQQVVLAEESLARHPNPEGREDTYIRNPEVENYFQMAADRAENGQYALRMGSVVSSPLPGDLHERIIDYSTVNRSAFGDIFLLGNCKFTVAGGAGIFWVSEAFDRPVVMIDNSPAGWRPPGFRDLFIPPKLWVKPEQRYMTFRESIKAAPSYMFQDAYERDGIGLVLATPDEISAVAREMDQRLEGIWADEDEDEELQRRFNSCYSPNDQGYQVPGRIGAEFLRKYAYLLD
jgi:putative glycosyltransferase (TIGR04372 family)